MVVRKSLWVILRRVPFCGLIRFIGITGGVQDLGVEPRYLAGEIPRKFQYPLTSYNFSLRGYNGEVLWRSTATISTILQSGSSSLVVIYSGGSLAWRTLE